MIELELGGSRRARVWLNELPVDARFDPEDALSSDPITGRPHRSDVVGRVAIEALFPTGPMWHYGLLGGTFEVDDTARFQGSVGYRSLVFSQDHAWTLLPAGVDRLAVGLPLWGAQAIVGLLGFPGENLDRLPSGLFSLTHAVIGEAGSSPSILQAIAFCLTAVVSEVPGRLTADRLADVVRDGLQQGFATRR